MSSSDAPTIVIIDDEASVRASLESLVRSMGFRALSYACAEDFLACLDSAASNCIVSDVQMPGMNGIELTERLCERGSTPPVILLTASADAELLERAATCGAKCVLTKPFTATTLLERINAAIDD